MPRFEHGYKRAINEIIGGIIASILVNVFILSGLLQASWIFLFNLLNTLGIIILILSMPYWGTVYLLGWLFGLAILIKAGLVNLLEAIIYFGIPLVILIVRVIKSCEEYPSAPIV